MVSPLLLSLLKSLDAKTQRMLRAWLSSPLFNTSDQLLAFYDALARVIAGAGELPERLTIWRAAYPGETYSEKQWNYATHQLMNQVRDFLAWREWSQDRGQVDYYRCVAMRKLNQEKLFLKSYHGGLQKLEKAPYRDEQYYQNVLRLKSELGKFSSVRRGDDMLRLFAENDFLGATIYEFNHLRAKCQPLVEQAIARYRRERPVPTGIQIYEALHHATQNPERPEYYFNAKSLFLEHVAIFQAPEQRTLYLLFINYSIHQMNNGNTDFSAEAFEWYKKGLENDVLYENQQLSTATYKNIVTAGLRLKKLEWTLRFIEDYKAKLPPRARQTTYLYNLAVYYFSLPDHAKVMEILRDVDWGKDLYAALDGRAMLLRIYYDSGYQEALESLLDSFQVFLRRNAKNIGYAKSHYLNLIKIVRLLLQIKHNERVADRKALVNKINGLQNLAEREWLLEKINERK